MSEFLVPKMQRWLQGHAGIISVPTLMSFGMSRRDAYRLARSDGFELLMPGVLRSTHWPVGPQQLMMAACHRSPLVVVFERRAAREWKFRGLGADDGEVQALIPHGNTVVLPGVDLRRSRRIDAIDIVTRRDGIRLTSPTRTMFDCADILGVKRTASIFEQLIDEGKGTFVTHATTVARLARPGRPGTRTMVAVLASRPKWRAAMQSELEVLVLGEIARQVISPPVTQLPVTLADGSHIRLDFAWPDERVALEVDHPFWHAGAVETHRDKRRDRMLATDGWQTIRITDLDVHGALPASMRDVAAVLARRRFAHNSPTVRI